MDPPGRTKSHDGKVRRIGVEIEFAALAADAAAELVKKVYGGTIEQLDAHRFLIRDTEFGDFECELDTQYAHKKDASDSDGRETIERFEAAVREWIGHLSGVIVPSEIVGPPIDLFDLPSMDRIAEALRLSGAEGTDDNPLYAFGMQLNPEVASIDAGYLVAMLRAYLLCSDWLRAEIQVDPLRRILAYANPFPENYVAQVCDPDYWPDRRKFIQDYLEENPTRNRELDMLPLFTWLDEDRVRAVVDDPRVKSRPTFHYRLPDARLSDPNWSIVREWNRWAAIERLAEDSERLHAMAQAFTDQFAQGKRKDWANVSRRWIES